MAAMTSQPQAAQPTTAPTSLPPIQSVPLADTPAEAPATVPHTTSGPENAPSVDSTAPTAVETPKEFGSDSGEISISHYGQPQTPAQPDLPQTPKPDEPKSGPVEDPFYK